MTSSDIFDKYKPTGVVDKKSELTLKLIIFLKLNLNYSATLRFINEVFDLLDENDTMVHIRSFVTVLKFNFATETKPARSLICAVLK